MASSTTKTVLGFVRAWFSRRIPLGEKNTTIPGIYNYVELDGLFPTSGQPSELELEAICEEGFDLVVNLAPKSVLENSVVDEAAILEGRGVEYVHMPVDFQNPTDEDFDRFREVIESSADRKLWVHCAANMRVSAFTYRYRTTVLGQDAASASEDLHKIWEPFGVWTDFIQPGPADEA